jgi:phosphopantetheinyl transferase
MINLEIDLSTSNCLVFVQDDLQTPINDEISDYFLQQLLKDLNINDQIEYSSNGKPYFTDSNLFLNISHSANIWVAVICKYPVGIDVEIVQNTKLISSLDPILGVQNLNDWCAQEAIIKCLDLTLDEMVQIKALHTHHEYQYLSADIYTYPIHKPNCFVGYVACQIPRLQIAIYNNYIGNHSLTD